MQHLKKVLRKWVVVATAVASLAALPVAAAARPEVQTVARLEIATSLCAFAVFLALQTLRPMRELRHLHVLHASAGARVVSQAELQSILSEVHGVVQSKAEEELMPRRRSTDKTDS